MKKLLFASISLLLGTQALAAPVSLTVEDMDRVTAGVAPSPTGFVCPVIKTDAVLNSPNSGALPSGEYTIGGPVVRIPMHATNDNGAGSPGGAHASPGDSTYTAIWYTP